MEKYNADVLVVGAGAVGVSIARELSKFSIKTIVVDKLNDVGGDASKSNSAIIHTGFDAPPGSVESTMVVSSNPMYDKLCDDLEIPFERVGAVLVATTEEEKCELPGIIEKAYKNHVYDLELLTPDEALKLEPGITKDVKGGIFVPRESIIDPFLLVVALAENAAANGVEFLTGWEVKKLSIDAGGFLAESEKGEVRAKFVVNAAGLFADKISGFLGINDFKVHPRRGQFHVLDKDASVGTKRIVLPVPTKVTKGKICTPTTHHNWIIGPTAEELDDKNANETNEEGLSDIVEGVKKLVPTINPGDAITQYAGLRPVRTPGGYHLRTFDNIPGYLELSGIRSTGVSSSPAVARYGCEKLQEMGLSRKHKKNFVSKRKAIPSFSEADMKTRAEMIKNNSLYGKIICRCETVTEAEIVEAVTRIPGAKDIDGIKRRVRAGLGRCQGGFCGMRIPQILARELNIPIEQVTKKGPGSEILQARTKTLRGTK